MVKGRNAKTIKELREVAEAKEAGLHDAEIIALRLASGLQHAKYNPVLRALAKGENVAGSKYPTTIQVIVSAIRKLASAVKVPKDNVMYRGVKVALGSEFYVLDFQVRRWHHDRHSQTNDLPKRQHRRGRVSPMSCFSYLSWECNERTSSCDRLRHV